jgi:hypothetical protein
MENSAADSLVVDTVRTIRDRFGVEGLRDLVTLATRELEHAERAAALNSQKAAFEDEPLLDGSPPEMADTQAWIAFTGDDDRL